MRLFIFIQFILQDETINLAIKFFEHDQMRMQVCRYIFHFKEEKKHVLLFLNYLNPQYQNINFTAEYEKHNSLLFIKSLNMTIHLKFNTNNGLFTNLRVFYS